MSVFSDIAVLKRPTPEMKDWEFQLGELRFEVHDAEVELASQINSFEQFASAVDKLDMLLEHIDQNDGKLEKPVFELVNQNNELATALGIIMPYSFATEEEQAQAGNDVKQAATGDGDKQGFFAKAWETIKSFFVKIYNAIKGLFVKAGEDSKAEDAANNATLEKIKKMTPDELAKQIQQGLQKVRGVFLSPSTAKQMAKDVNTIADAFGSFVSISPLEFYDSILLNDKSPYGGAFDSIVPLLKNFGIEIGFRNEDGQPKSECKVVGGDSPYRTQAKDTMKNAAMFFGVSNPSEIRAENAAQYIATMESFLGPNGEIKREFKLGLKNLNDRTAKLEELLKVFSNEKEVEKIVAQRSAGWGDRGIAWVKRKIFRDKDAKALSSADQVRVRVTVAKDIGQALAGALKLIAKTISESSGLYKSTAVSLRAIVEAKVIRAANKDTQELNQRREDEAKQKAENNELLYGTTGSGIA